MARTSPVGGPVSGEFERERLTLMRYLNYRSRRGWRGTPAGATDPGAAEVVFLVRGGTITSAR
jgi:hypothetical protein